MKTNPLILDDAYINLRRRLEDATTFFGMNDMRGVVANLIPAMNAAKTLRDAGSPTYAQIQEMIRNSLKGE